MKPTTKQLSYLKDLALRRGITLAMPRTRAEASRQIERLRTTPTRVDLPESDPAEW